MILAILYQPYQPGGSGEEVISMFFHLEFQIKTILTIFRSPKPWKLHIKFGYILPSGFREKVVWRFGWIMDDRRTMEAAYPINSPGAFGSGEQKIQETFNENIQFPVSTPYDF